MTSAVAGFGLVPRGRDRMMQNVHPVKQRRTGFSHQSHLVCIVKRGQSVSAESSVSLAARDNRKQTYRRDQSQSS